MGMFGGMKFGKMYDRILMVNLCQISVPAKRFITKYSHYMVHVHAHTYEPGMPRDLIKL